MPLGEFYCILAANVNWC